MHIASSIHPANLAFVQGCPGIQVLSGFFLDKNLMPVNFSTLHNFKMTGLSYDEHDRAIQAANTQRNVSVSHDWVP